MMRMRRTEEDIAKIEEAWASGLTRTVIADRFGMSVDSLAALMRANRDRFPMREAAKAASKASRARGPDSRSWSDADLATAKTMWARGDSARAIGEAIGKSKNAILGLATRNRDMFAPRDRNERVTAMKIGQARRMSERAASGEGQKAKAPKPAVKPKQVWATRSADIAAARARADTEAAETRARLEDDAAEVAELDGVIGPIFRRVALMALTERCCKWPLGDPVKADFAFCGNDAPGASPYCTFHQRLAYQPKAGAA